MRAAGRTVKTITAPPDIDSAWPKNSPPADPEKLIDFLQEQVDSLRSDIGAAKKVVQLPAADPAVLDMPESVLDGRLGTSCADRLAAFPRAYSWPAMLAAASVLIDERVPGVRTNLYNGLVGGVHSGKSQAIERALKICGIEPPVLLDVMSGSAEQLVRKTKDAAGNPRLFCPDELGHLFEKAQIERSSYTYILNRAFYSERFDVLMGRRESATFNCALTILGGLVEEKFADLFNAASTGGLYDRFLFGLCPSGFRFDYFPFVGTAEKFAPVAVTIAPDVWEAKSEWLREDHNLNPRVVELAIRAATVCASIDGRAVLHAKDLAPAKALADYETRVRMILKPNPGENFEARLAHKFLAYLTRHGGRFVSRREMFRDTRAYDLGLSVAERALACLAANGDVVLEKKGKAELVRLAFDSEAQ